MKARIHVNQHNIKWNAKNHEWAGSNYDNLYARPVITVKTYKSNEYADSVEINGPSRVIYSPDKPLSCGARVWIECEYEDLDLIKSPNRNHRTQDQSCATDQ
jgi:hypothetical protein